MRRTFVMLAFVLAGLAPSTVAAASSRHRQRFQCPSPGVGVLTADAQAVVYKVESPLPRLEGIFGCTHASKRAYYLGPVSYGSASDSGGTYPIALAGPIGAYDTGERTLLPLPNGQSSHEIWVRNLRTGKVIYRMPNGSPAEPGDVGLGETTAIVVKSDASVAWIVRAGEPLGGIQVRSFDKTGSHLLAASPEIAPGSLALAGSTLYWTQGGKPMSAGLN